MARIYQPRTVRSMLRDHERSIRLNASASRFARSGMSVPEPDVTAVEGDLQAESFVAGSTGWRLQAGGDAEFNQITLRGGIIGNDALTSPVEVGLARNGATNFTIPVTSTSRASASIVVPAGYTRALISMATNASVRNPTAAQDYLYLDSWIGSSDSGGTVTVGAAAGQYVSVSGSCVADLSGLTGGQTVLCQARLSAGTAWAATATNIAAVNALAVFLRS